MKLQKLRILCLLSDGMEMRGDESEVRKVDGDDDALTYIQGRHSGVNL
jgi:hypothetical protein